MPRDNYSKEEEGGLMGGMKPSRMMNKGVPSDRSPVMNGKQMPKKERARIMRSKDARSMGRFR